MIRSLKVIINTHRIDLESHLDRCRRHQAVHPSIVDCASSNCYQQAASKCRFPSPATSTATDSPLIWSKCLRFLHFSFSLLNFFSCLFMFVMQVGSGKYGKREKWEKWHLLVEEILLLLDLLLTRWNVAWIKSA